MRPAHLEGGHAPCPPIEPYAAGLLDTGDTTTIMRPSRIWPLFGSALPD
jgi:hypothetical protein